MTQAEVAKAIGLTQNGYSYWENGKSKIDREQLLKLATLFDVSTDYLLGKEMPTPDTGDGLSDAERSLLELFRLVPDKDQAMVTQMIEAALKSRGLL